MAGGLDRASTPSFYSQLKRVPPRMAPAFDMNEKGKLPRKGASPSCLKSRIKPQSAWFAADALRSTLPAQADKGLTLQARR